MRRATQETCRGGHLTASWNIRSLIVTNITNWNRDKVNLSNGPIFFDSDWVVTLRFPTNAFLTCAKEH
jgi:hypothetical protein